MGPCSFIISRMYSHVNTHQTCYVVVLIYEHLKTLEYISPKDDHYNCGFYLVDIQVKGEKYGERNRKNVRRTNPVSEPLHKVNYNIRLNKFPLSATKIFSSQIFEKNQ